MDCCGVSALVVLAALGLGVWIGRGSRRERAPRWGCLALLLVATLSASVVVVVRATWFAPQIAVTVSPLRVEGVEPVEVVAVPVDRPRAVAPPRPITEAELTALATDLHVRRFGQVEQLRGAARPFLFTPTQAARVLMAFTFTTERIGALEVLGPRLLDGDRSPIYDQFRGPFGGEAQARLVLGE